MADVPPLDHVFTIDVDITPPLTNGPGVNGERKHIPISGGTVAGPMLNGKVLPGGYDWLWQRPDGVAEISAHYSLQANDGTFIYVRNIGLRVAIDETRDLLKAGKPVDPHAYYFRAAPVFDVPDGPHQWLREHLFISHVTPRNGGVAVDVFCVR